MQKKPALASVEKAIKTIKEGKLIIIVDDEDRENEGDLTCAAEKVTPDIINFMAKHARGLICLSLTKDKLRELDLPQMVTSNTAPFKTAFTVSVVLKRAGQTEASVDIARLAGLTPAGVICEIMNEDGTMARRGELEKFSETYDIPILTIAELIKYRMQHEIHVKKIEEADLPTKYGHFKIMIFEDTIYNEHHVVLIKGEIKKGEPILVRAHSQCLTGDTFHSKRCDCGEQLHLSMKMIEKEKKKEKIQWKLTASSDLNLTRETMGSELKYWYPSESPN